MNAIDWVNQKYNKKNNFPHFKAGDSVRVHVKIKEGDKERVQVYEGVVIGIHRKGSGSSFTVRKVSYGTGVERIFPFSCPAVEKIEVTNVGKVRRGKIYYLRDLAGKKARIASVDKLGLAKREEIDAARAAEFAEAAEADATEASAEQADAAPAENKE
ncbi:MAG: 50S ribosomal protein L19 [Deltaproteobacteria bacterium]|nr:50S ribosomal protein L19 [Deltaproteobacteria bacterium]